MDASALSTLYAGMMIEITDPVNRQYRQITIHICKVVFLPFVRVYNFLREPPPPIEAAGAGLQGAGTGTGLHGDNVLGHGCRACVGAGAGADVAQSSTRNGAADGRSVNHDIPPEFCPPS